jgi:hypothetical protein
VAVQRDACNGRISGRSGDAAGTAAPDPLLPLLEIAILPSDHRNGMSSLL